jgi:hypothetical protein
MVQARKKVLYLITKATWGGAFWETQGFPTWDTPRAGMRAEYPTPSSTGKQNVFPTPFLAPPSSIIRI